jgi:hypothetical protein
MTTGQQAATPAKPAKRTRLVREVRSNAAAFHRGELVLHAIALVFVALLFVFALVALGGAKVAACAVHDNLNQERGLLLAAFTAGGFVLGRLIGVIRFHIREGIHSSNRPAPHPTAVLDVAFVLFLAVTAVLLGYETWSLANGGHPPPITSYVRCAAYHQLPLAAITAGSIGFMVSSWLWFPSK